MKKDKRISWMHLEDMLLAIDRILRYTEGLDYESFEKNQLIIDAVLRNFTVLGEASKNVPKELKANYPEIPWREMSDLRNRITHEYFGVDYQIIWRVITHFITEQKSQIAHILAIERKTQ